jgi:hypothetical protein
VKVLNSKEIANHAGPESCVAYREVRDEALTGEPAGQPLSRESFKLVQGADAVSVAEGNTGALLRVPMKHGQEKSDLFIVALKPANKPGRPGAELTTQQVAGASGSRYNDQLTLKNRIWN